MPEDNLTLSIRLHDPAEKKDANKSTGWVVEQIPRADLAMSLDDFVEKYVKPAFLANLGKFFTSQQSGGSAVVEESVPHPVEALASSHPPTADATVVDMSSPSAVALPDTAAPVETPQPSSASETSATVTAPQKS
jgi:hypothetical protein